MKHNAGLSSFDKSDSWVVLSPIEAEIKQKIEKIGTPLKNWDIQINYGIKTGYNEAFIIDGKKKDELIAQDSKSVEIIRPILRGRDVKRYGYEFADLFLIATFPSRKYDIDNFPAIREHLLGFGYDRLKQTGEIGARKKTNNKWFETQDSISYWEDFNSQKIVWARLMRISKNDVLSFPRFALLEEGLYVLDSLCFFSGKELLYLQGLLNSEYAKYYFFNNIAILDNGGMQMRQQFVENIPIPISTTNIKKEIENAVLQIIQGLDVELNNSKINEYVYNLFDFNESEVNTIKSFIKNKIKEIIATD